MIISVIVTTYNEEEAIISLLESLKRQIVQAGEIVICDAGSSDKTVMLIQNWSEENGDVSVNLLVKNGVNRSVGRNIAIEAAENDYIATTDAGCVVEKDWVQELEKGFGSADSVDAVAGFYKPVFENTWMEIFSWFTSTYEEDLNVNEYIPSARSAAFTKECWMRVGKFPENLETCEDLVFFRNVKNSCKMAVSKEAVVLWNQASDLWGFMSQIAGYTSGDVAAKYQPHLWRILSVYGRYILFFIFPPLFLIYLFFPLFKFRKRITAFDKFWKSIVVQICADLAVMWGGLVGIKLLLDQ